MVHAKPIEVPYADVRSRIADGDLLLFRRRRGSLIGKLITTAGRGIHCHAAKAIWWGDDLFCCEVREFLGGRAVLLSREVRRMPGRIDVWETNPGHRQPYNRVGASRFMRRLAGCRYGWAAIARAALLHLPFVRLIARPNLDDESVEAIETRPPFCSAAVAMADRIGGGVDPVNLLADAMVEPADLARSGFYRYRFTLVP